MEEASQTYKFSAFISYRHSDMAAAKRLQRLLESYNLPADIRPQVKDAPRRFRVFRDTDELTSGILNEELRKKLEESKFLIVICSPNSAESKYVGDEIAYFRSLGREKRIIPFIIAGKPDSNTDNCYHQQMTFGGLELLGIDVNAEKGSFGALRFHKAFIRVVARMLDLDFGVLWKRRKRLYIQLACIASLLTIAVAAAITYFALKAHNERPFDASITLTETVAAPHLSLNPDENDSIWVYLGDDIRGLRVTDLSQPLSIQNIPGAFRDREVKVVSNIYGFNPLDTMVSLTPDVSLIVTRDPEVYGRVWHAVLDSNNEQPVAGARFDIAGVIGVTDADGVLDIMVPLEHQRTEGYIADITLAGKKMSVVYDSVVKPLRYRTTPAPIYIKAAE